MAKWSAVMAACLLTAAVGAGCIGTETDTTGARAPSEDGDLPGPAAVAPILLAGCHQIHMFFFARAQDVASAAPGGFEVEADERGLTTVSVVASSCGDQTEVMVRIPVVPPPGLADEDAFDVATVVGYVSTAAALEAYAAAGLGDRVHLATIAFETVDTPVSAATRIDITAGGDENGYLTALRPSSGAFDEETSIVWIGDAEGPTGRLVAAGSESTNRGVGGAAFRSNGAGGAPPLSGGIAHEVVGIDMTLTWEAVR